LLEPTYRRYVSPSSSGCNNQRARNNIRSN
jgi:hypothetical protein